MHSIAAKNTSGTYIFWTKVGKSTCATNYDIQFPVKGSARISVHKVHVGAVVTPEYCTS